MPDHSAPWGWAGTVDAFLREGHPQWLESVEAHYLRCAGEPPSESNVVAWKNEHSVLRQVLEELTSSNPRSVRWHLVFEYELPRERGRRPDVVVLADKHVIVLEFKGYSSPMPAHVDQASAYARDLAEYHRASRDRDVDPVLVLTQYCGETTLINHVLVTGPAGLLGVLQDLASDAADARDPDDWLRSDYEPLPSLVNAARIIFEHEPLPHVRRAHSAGIPEALSCLEHVAARARREQQLHLALVTGVPGAGKTLVGLQFVYQSHFGEEDDRPAVFLSGNGPLVKVLQYTLRSRVFVQDVHGFLKTYAGSERLPHEHIWVFDEAQRAFDAEYAKFKFQRAGSEPEDFLRLGERLGSWAMMVGLIGEGQSINAGEEAGLPLWNDALAKLDRPWTVHCPDRVSGLFANAADVRVTDELDLDITLRSHLADSVHLWVAQLLAGEIASASKTAHEAKASGFGMYVTRDIEAARIYARDRYAGEPDKRFGLLASAKARNLPFYGFLNSFDFTSRMKIGPWFNDPPGTLTSCCSFRETATEFQCQGLELDMPVVGWGDDFWWTGIGWTSKPSRSRAPIKDAHQIRTNAYRVLLTRGRDGVVVFVPPEEKLDLTYQVLIDAGMVHLQRIWF